MSTKSEKYSSKKAKLKHEKREGAKERMKEYGSKTPKGFHRMPNGKLMKGSKHRG